MRRKNWILIPLAVPAVYITLRAIARFVRRRHRFPIPEFMAEVIDNPLRRAFIQPPDEMPERLGLKPGMRVLEVGPGSGTYTVAVARYLGPAGHLTSIDIEPKMIERTRARIAAEGLTNVDARVADVFALPFGDGTFDAVYMIAVIGEIPTPERAAAAFARVLKPGGLLAFSELWPDPDYPHPRELEDWIMPAGFEPVSLERGFLSYYYVFARG
jgi:ubiquinone/menaquinone biosynthesis C-methylase UbiE